jgi:hypothetical protein
MLPIPPDASFLELFSSFGEDSALVPYELGEWNKRGTGDALGFQANILDNIDHFKSVSSYLF